MIIHNVSQRSEEWFALRMGRATASRAGDMLSTGRGNKGVGTAQARYHNELVVEQLNNVSAERPFGGNRHTERGITLEEEAVAAWEARMGVLVMPVGFVAHDTLMAGCSPDGIVYGDGLTILSTIEVKSPIQAIHYETLRTQEIVDKTHKAQLLHSVVLTGAVVGVFLSYCPLFSPPDDLVAVEQLFNENERSEYLGKLECFLERVAAEVQSRKPTAQQLKEALDA